MVVKIAVFFDQENQLATMSNIDKIVIYEKKEKWEVVHVIQEMNVDLSSMAAMRNYIIQIAKRLGDCKYVVGAEILGIAYHLLNSFHIEMCEAEQFSELLLDQIAEDFILNDVKSQQSPLKVEMVPKEPHQIGEDGKYFLDMILLQKKYPEITSKKALLPFLDKTVFYELTVVCSHVMPWLETECSKRNLTFQTQEEKGRWKVTIYRKVCN